MWDCDTVLDDGDDDGGAEIHVLQCVVSEAQIQNAHRPLTVAAVNAGDDWT